MLWISATFCPEPVPNRRNRVGARLYRNRIAEQVDLASLVAGEVGVAAELGLTVVVRLVPTVEGWLYPGSRRQARQRTSRHRSLSARFGSRGSGGRRLGRARPQRAYLGTAPSNLSASLRTVQLRTGMLASPIAWSKANRRSCPGRLLWIQAAPFWIRYELFCYDRVK